MSPLHLPFLGINLDSFTTVALYNFYKKNGIDINTFLKIIYLTHISNFVFVKCILNVGIR